jgi:uncharacterized membrane protein YcaP (DUF421 family)
MDAVFRAAAIYLFLLLVFRIFGKRALSQITTFDFVMLLIIAETTQQALVGEDFSVTSCFLLVSTLLVIDRLLSYIKRHSWWFESISEGRPLIILKDGKPIEDRMEKSGVDVAEVLTAARELQGLERLEQIKFAILERGGVITIIPRESAK